ncbi:MAG: hypothetical protein JWL62_1558, partial [Hyphomicrobiales bacterium]|nr:hypothetical protein [Hyphomicrobiales bacterium]
MSLDAGTPPRTYSDREHLTVTPELQSRTRYGEVEVPLRMRIAARLRQGADNVVQGCIAGAARFGVPSVLDAHGALATRLDQSIRSEARVGARTLMVGACLAIVFGA